MGLDTTILYREFQANLAAARDASRGDAERVTAGTEVINYRLSAPLPNTFKVTELLAIVIDPNFIAKTRIEASVHLFTILQNCGDSIPMADRTTDRWNVRNIVAKSLSVPEEVRVAFGMANLADAEYLVGRIGAESRYQTMAEGKYANEVKTAAGRKWIDTVCSRYEEAKVNEILQAIINSPARFTLETIEYARTALEEIANDPVAHAKKILGDRNAPREARINAGLTIIATIGPVATTENLNTLVAMTNIFKNPTRVVNAAEIAVMEMFEKLEQTPANVAALKILVVNGEKFGTPSNAVIKAKNTLDVIELKAGPLRFGTTKQPENNGPRKPTIKV